MLLYPAIFYPLKEEKYTAARKIQEVLIVQTMITAHSGCEGTADNSIAHIQCALRCCVEAMEIDVHPGTDGLFYLSHDVAEDSQSCPSLTDAFSLIQNTGMKINCDLKAPGIEARVLEMAQAWQVEDQLILSGCVSRKALEDTELRKHVFWNIEEALPSLSEKFSRDIPPTLAEVQTALDNCREAGVSVINVYYELCTPEMLEACRKAGILVSAWTVNNEDWARTLLDAGIYNVTTRKPVLVRGLREQLG